MLPSSKPRYRVAEFVTERSAGCRAIFFGRIQWDDCFEERIFDGVDTVLLNEEGRKNIPFGENRSRFIYLCPDHFELGVGNLKSNEDLHK